MQSLFLPSVAKTQQGTSLLENQNNTESTTEWLMTLQCTHTHTYPEGIACWVSEALLPSCWSPYAQAKEFLQKNQFKVLFQTTLIRVMLQELSEAFEI